MRSQDTEQGLQQLLMEVVRYYPASSRPFFRIMASLSCSTEHILELLLHPFRTYTIPGTYTEHARALLPPEQQHSHHNQHHQQTIAGQNAVRVELTHKFKDDCVKIPKRCTGRILMYNGQVHIQWSLPSSARPTGMRILARSFRKTVIRLEKGGIGKASSFSTSSNSNMSYSSAASLTYGRTMDATAGVGAGTGAGAGDSNGHRLQHLDDVLQLLSKLCTAASEEGLRDILRELSIADKKCNLLDLVHALIIVPI